MSEINDYFERNEIYLFDHLAPALITFSVIKEEHAHINRIYKIRSKNSISANEWEDYWKRDCVCTDRATLSTIVLLVESAAKKLLIQIFQPPLSVPIYTTAQRRVARKNTACYNTYHDCQFSFTVFIYCFIFICCFCQYFSIPFEQCFHLIIYVNDLVNLWVLCGCCKGA